MPSVQGRGPPEQRAPLVRVQLVQVWQALLVSIPRSPSSACLSLPPGSDPTPALASRPPSDQRQLQAALVVSRLQSRDRLRQFHSRSRAAQNGARPSGSDATPPHSSS